VRVTRNAASGEEQVRITAPASARWVTVQVRRGEAWRTWVLPGTYRTLVIGGAEVAPADDVVVRAVHRNGRESAAVVQRGARAMAGVH
jgi:hypothetical protein